ncbi:MAG: dUTP diphosphatase [Clostridiales bacterium]|nr:dUTP diphosphatase [Clostridiales bacterium]
MKVKIKKLTDSAIIPTYGSSGSAGGDLYACLEEEVTVAPNQTVLIGTGLAVQIPDGYVGLVYARSGLATKSGLAPANKVGVIDSDYRGEIKVALHNHSLEMRTVKSGDRIAQMVIAPYLKVEYEQVSQLTDTERGEGGFGSTGKN